ncbi:MAG: phosphoglycerate dehydrogenase [Tractidigestivibacter sp.]|jgi:D-3-phosphoglycerate dehydrogenase|uniref:phosphoglycerate dehydrogenase n=1 Tax=Tractidigestivibacter sp. TaxID=2847320 RepID=UPI003D916CAF
MYKVHCMNNISRVGTDKLGGNYELVSELDGADAILVRSANLHEVEFPSSLLAIARAGAGVNNIPLDTCAQKGIVVFNTPGANANAVKELVIAGMLLSCRDIVGGINWVSENSDDPDVGKKAEKAKKQFAGRELAGKTLGVIGLGAIGSAVANSGRQLGMKVLGYDPYLSINAAWSLDRNIQHVTDINEIWANADFITIHVPAMDSTKGMISREAIEKMKHGVVVLNYARDVLVDEQAMAAALDSGKVAHYMTDFANPQSCNMKNAIVTPHLGASTSEAEDNCAVMAVSELRDYIENGNIKNSVNFGAVDLGVLTTGFRIALFHKNVQGMIGKITNILSEADLNIENMANKSRGEYAYTLIDVASGNVDEVAKRVAALNNVVRVRVINAQDA